MLKSFTWLLTICLAHASEAPFWKSKEKVYQRIQNGEVIVGVHSENGAQNGALHNLVANGGGQVAAPRDFVFREAQKYDEMMRLSDYIKSASYDAATNVVTVEASAYGYQTRLQILVHAIPGEDAAIVEYRIISGALKGFSGQMRFSSLTPTKTEVGMHADFEYTKFPLPRLFLEFGMEVVFQRMAIRLRNYVEQEFQKTKSKDSA